jgi:hypothetical protein
LTTIANWEKTTQQHMPGGKMKLEKMLRVVVGISLTFVVMASVSAQTEKNVRGVKYQPLNVKTGLWERTLTLKRGGSMPIPVGMLDKLTPEQRARLEARMNASSSANSRTQTEKVCVTKEQLEQPINFSDQDCTWTILESTSKRASGNVSCRSQGITAAGTGNFEAPDQEHMKGSAHLVSSGGGNTMTTDANFASKWLSASCGNVQ